MNLFHKLKTKSYKSTDSIYVGLSEETKDHRLAQQFKNKLRRLKESAVHVPLSEKHSGKHIKRRHFRSKNVFPTPPTYARKDSDSLHIPSQQPQFPIPSDPPMPLIQQCVSRK